MQDVSVPYDVALVGGGPAFELSVANVDKPALAPEEVRRRLAQFAWRAAVWLTRAPTYTEKAELFPGCVFVVGADTAARIVQPRFYQDSEEQMARRMGPFSSSSRSLVWHRTRTVPWGL